MFSVTNFSALAFITLTLGSAFTGNVSAQTQEQVSGWTVVIEGHGLTGQWSNHSARLYKKGQSYRYTYNDSLDPEKWHKTQSPVMACHLDGTKGQLQFADVGCTDLKSGCGVRVGFDNRIGPYLRIPSSSPKSFGNVTQYNAHLIESLSEKLSCAFTTGNLGL